VLNYHERELTGKGANRTLFGGAIVACVAGGQTGRGCLFRRYFFASFDFVELVIPSFGIPRFFWRQKK
jgi:hypothetical protein